MYSTFLTIINTMNWIEYNKTYLAINKEMKKVQRQTITETQTFQDSDW